MDKMRGELMTKETLWQKWCKHYRSGGVFYAVYRGVKYLAWRIRMVRLNRLQRKMK